MKSHLVKCNNVADNVKAWAKDWTKDSLLSGSNAADNEAMTSSHPLKPSLTFMLHKVTPMTNAQQDDFDTLLLRTQSLATCLSPGLATSL